ncbi:hypothetical protein JCM6882_006410 [Rhodosporidiobolus microsporus]
MARLSPSPVASTSRIPYTSPSSPFSTSPVRTFSSSTPSLARTARAHARGNGSSAHFLHPLLRQRLTNLTFLVAGALSIATVSLTMSGSLADAGIAPGCPARSAAGVAAQEERKRMREREQQRESGSWWTKGRFLEDPVSAPAAPLIVPPAPPAAARQEKAAAAAAAPAPTRRGEDVDGPRIADSRAERPASAGWGWKADERVV